MWAVVMLLAGCATPSSAPTTSPAPAPSASPTITPPSPSPTRAGARLRVELEGASACDNGFICSARLGVLPESTIVDPTASLEPSTADAIWQSDYGLAADLAPPPDGDLPALAPGGHVIVWSVTTQRIVTDLPTATPELASRCSAPIVVAADAISVTIRIRFAGASTLGAGSARCTMRRVADAATTAEPTPGSISGAALTPAARLPTAWRRVSTANLADLGDPGFVVTLGVAPDGAFIAIPDGGERRALSILRSVDGKAWTKVGVLPASRDGWVHTMASDGDVIVAAGGSSDPTRPTMWVSTDGVHWTAMGARLPNGPHGVDALASNSAGFVATQSWAGAAPWIGDSRGEVWDRVGSLTATVDASMLDVAAFGSGFVAVGGVGGSAAAWVSSDGRVWAPATVAGGAGVMLVAVAGDERRLVAFGQGSYPREGPLVFVSDDGGRSWAPVVAASRPRSASPPIQAVADGFIATDYGVWTSPDGVAWDDTAWTHAVGDAIPGRVPSVAANGAVVVAAAMPDGSGTPIFWIGETGTP
jgi:hypothetical protein